MEVTITRHNEMIDPTVHVWGWEIPVYLFLGGMVAGMMILSGYFFLKGRSRDLVCVCYRIPLIGLVLISLGMLALFLDLEHKLYVWRLYTTFEIKSPMSWGSWILLLVYPALLANFFMYVPDPIRSRLPFLQNWSDKLRSLPNAPIIVGKFNIAVGILLGTYTGLLLSSLGARPLWNSAILGLLFLTSGLSTAAAFVHMIAKDQWERETLAKADNMFLTAELVILALFIINMLSSSEVQIRAAMLLLTGPYAATFWVFVILLGILVPLFIQTRAVKHKVIHTPIAPLLVMLGGLILRFILVGAGQLSHYALYKF
ncbi:MAG: polysulfide reductase NrfD [candidate division KSB1 bacterium]|nr:polysulfide reductase NrfD [candidate division KSB1 bacterium]